MTARQKTVLRKAVFFAIDVVLVALILFPIYPGIVGSLESSRYVASPSFLPRTWQFQNYIDIWRYIPLLSQMINGLLYGFSSTLIVMVIGVFSAYAVSRFRFRAKGAYLLVILVTQMFGIATIIVPLFILFLKLGLFDTRLAVILVLSALSLPMAIWLLRAYFDSIPIEIDEAGMIDGCTRFRSIISLIVPMAAPGLVSSFVIIFTQGYRQFFVPLILLYSHEKFPALIGVFTLANDLAPPWHLVMTGSIITMLPPILLFLGLHRYVVSGLSAGAIKA